MATVTIDRDIKVKLSPEGKECLAVDDDFIAVRELRKLYERFDEKRRLNGDDKAKRFHEVLSTCDVILPEPIYAPRNPELEARVQKLKKLQENRDYERMTDNVDPLRNANNALTSAADEPISKQLKDLNRYLVLIFQFVVSMVSAFFFGYLAPYYFYGTVAIGPRLLYGIIWGFVVGVADLYFVLRYLLETEGVLTTTSQTKEKEH